MLYITSSGNHPILSDKKITKREVDGVVERGRGNRDEGMNRVKG